MNGLPLIFQEDFQTSQTDRWEPVSPEGWRIEDQNGNKVYSQFKNIPVKTPVRSPFNRNCLKEVVVGSFVLDLKFQSTARDYPHRSLCLFFGYQDPAHMYYVHFGQKTDAHANQIFLVDNKDRAKISTKTTDGTPWDNEWHKARIVRDVDSGSIEIFFDDLKTPVMTAVDKSFSWGQIGIGSFDDSGNFDDIRLYGKVVEKPKTALPQSETKVEAK
jgi:hypothetical protein